MEGKEFLKHGDLTSLASKMEVSRDHLIKVANGQLKNERITVALEKLIQLRRNEIAEIAESVIHN